MTPSLKLSFLSSLLASACPSQPVPPVITTVLIGPDFGRSASQTEVICYKALAKEVVLGMFFVYSRNLMATLGITGLANTGKTSLFAALTGRPEGIAPFPFSTTETRLGVARIVDPILEQLGGLEGSARITPAALEVTDGPPLNKSGGELDAQTVGKLRQADCLVVVLRAFTDPSVPDTESGVDPTRQAEEVILEMAISDAEMFEGSVVRLRNQATSRPERRAAYEAVARASEISREGGLLRSAQWSDVERTALADFAPLTLKPMIWVVNVEEEQLSEAANGVGEVVPAGDRVLTMDLGVGGRGRLAGHRGPSGDAGRLRAG